VVLSVKTVRVACLLAVLALVGPRSAQAADPALDLERLTVPELQRKLAAGELTSVQVTRAYINRIAAVNARGPGINAVRLINPSALQDAAVADLERATGHSRGPWQGIPVLVTDNLDVAGLPTTAGSVALQNSVPPRDSTVVAKLRAAGGWRGGVTRHEPRQARLISSAAKLSTAGASARTGGGARGAWRRR
jgi:amidase